MTTQKISNEILNVKHLIVHKNITIYIINIPHEKNFKIINAYLYSIAKRNRKYLLNHHIFLKFYVDRIEMSIEKSFFNIRPFFFEHLVISNKTLFIPDTESDITIIKSLLRKEKIKEILEV
jgi:hypothetical protein